MVSSHWVVAISFGAASLFVSAAAGQVAESTPPASGFLNTSDTGLTSPAVPKKPTVTLTPEMRGDIFMAEKRFREAADMYQENSKGSAVMLNKTGIAYHQMLQLNLAEKYYRLALHVDPTYSEAINNLGTIYYAKKSYRRAINQYKRALRLSPDSASVWSNLGTGYFARKEYEQAAQAFQTALKLNPEVFESRSTQGVLLQERSVEERAKFHYYLAQTYAKAGMNDRAVQYIRKALEEGFKEKKKIEDDPAFASMKDLPEFKELMASEPRVL
ncbi:MAG: tetratricopeptide repeat protein [Bryobacteraceae bacterium]|jgi:tetratricopeptide (TPR) repeat protein